MLAVTWPSTWRLWAGWSVAGPSQQPAAHNCPDSLPPRHYPICNARRIAQIRTTSRHGRYKIKLLLSKYLLYNMVTLELVIKPKNVDILIFKYAVATQLQCWRRCTDTELAIFVSNYWQALKSGHLVCICPKCQVWNFTRKLSANMKVPKFQE